MKTQKEIIDDTYYDISCYMAEGTDTDDANQVKESIEEAIQKSLNMYLFSDKYQIKILIELIKYTQTYMFKSDKPRTPNEILKEFQLSIII